MKRYYLFPLCCACVSGCSSDEPDHSVENAVPFELLCEHETYGTRNRISYQVAGDDIVFRTDGDEWLDICDPQSAFETLDCSSSVQDTKIVVRKKMQFRNGERTDLIEIDRVTGKYSLTEQ